MIDLLNPDLNSLRAYMNDPNMLPGIDQDWEIVITGDITAGYLLTLSLENTKRHDEVVELLYLYTESVLRNWYISSRGRLEDLLNGLPNDLPPDVLKWKEDSRKALSDPEIANKNPTAFGDCFFAEYFGHGRIF